MKKPLLRFLTACLGIYLGIIIIFSIAFLAGVGFIAIIKAIEFLCGLLGLIA